MRVDKPKAEDYDEIYRASEIYRGAPEDSPYYPLWTEILELLQGGEKILDIGCGPGQFGELCVKAGYGYKGLDFSGEAIKIAKDRGYGVYEKWDIEENPLPLEREKYDVATFIEFFEHVPNDLELLRRVPPGRAVVFSVPNYPDKRHFRYFVSSQQARSRYQPYLRYEYSVTLSGKNVYNEIAEIYLFRGVKR